MKILISSDGRHAHYYQRMSWAKAFVASGHTAVMWDIKNVNPFDAFDTFEPDIFLGQLYNLDSATIKCIKERPHLRVGLRAGDWGDHEKEVDKSKYNILFCSNKEKENLKKLKDETGKPDFIHIHYTPEAIKQTHNEFEKLGIPVKSIMMCADTFEYSNSLSDRKFQCDIGFVGGYWPYKGQVIDRYLKPMLYPVGKYNIKIFGNQPWQVNQYCGVIKDHEVKNLFKSAKVCPNLSEPHAQKFGFDVNERIFKVIYSGGFCVSDYVEGYNLFKDGVVLAKTPEEFREKIDYYLDKPNERDAISKKGRDIVIKNHTGYDRAAEIMKSFGYSKNAESIILEKNKNVG